MRLDLNTEHLLEIIRKFRNVRIAVLGDMMLDVYFWGKATRISPEAPVPVVEVERITRCLGGAANVMRNIVTLGGSAAALGIVGDDADAAELVKELASYGIRHEFVVRDPARRTTHKERVIAGNQQLVRIDHEDTFAASAEIRQQLVNAVLHLIENREIDAIIFEDYRKGLLDSSMLEAIIPAAKAAGIITALDPKPGSLTPVPGLSVIKPNRSEAFAMANCSAAPGADLDGVAHAMLDAWKPEHLLISLAAEGLALYDEAGHKTVIPTRAREVFDVSGAGDTLIAAFSMALAAGATPEEAAEIGNFAAGIVVGKVGTVTVEAEEVIQEISKRGAL